MTRRLAVMLALLALVAAGRTPPAAAKGNSYGEYVKAVRALEQWRFEDAHELIDALAKAQPDAPEVKYLQGQMAFLDGDYLRARKLLAGITSPDLKNNVKDILPLVESTEEATRGFLRQDSPKGHFVIYYPAGKDEILVELAGETLDAAWETMKADLGYAPPGQVRVEILERTSDLARVSSLTEKAIETSGTIALCKYGKLMIVSPRATVLGYPWLDTLAHEYTHYVVTRLSNDQVPIWLHEGLAKYQETRWRGEPGAAGMGRVNEHLLAMALKKGRLITFEEMHPSMAYLPSQEAAATAFAEVYAFVDWLHGEVGYAGIRQVIAKIKDGKSERRAIAEVMDKKWSDVEAAWKKHLKTLPLRIDPTLAQPGASKKIRLKKSDGDTENVGVDQIGEEKARKHARLGGLLRARGRLPAAALEYEKAIAIVGHDDPWLLSKLARTYLDMGEPKKAVELLEKDPDRDPDDAGPQATLGQAYLSMGEYDQARLHFEIAVRVQPFDPEVRCGLAEVYGQGGRKAEATRETEACRVARGGAPRGVAPKSSGVNVWDSTDPTGKKKGKNK